MSLLIHNIKRVPGGFTCTTPSSDDDFYRLTVAQTGEGLLVSCGCDGYRFRCECKHARQLHADCEAGIERLLEGAA